MRAPRRGHRCGRPPDQVASPQRYLHVLAEGGQQAHQPFAREGRKASVEEVGFLVFTPPVAASLSRVVRTTVIDARPDGAGRLMLHWNRADAIELRHEA